MSAKFSKKEQLILHLLIGSMGTECRGLELVRKSKGVLKRGTIYVHLARLEDRAYISSRVLQDTCSIIATRVYKPTDLGVRKYISKWSP